MKNEKFKRDKGQAGLTILLSLIVMLFVIGLLIMIFSLMGSELETATYDELTSVSVANETIGVPTTAGISLAGSTKRDGSCGTITYLINNSNYILNSANYSQTGCTVRNATNMTIHGTAFKATYSYTWSADNTATDVMNESVVAIATTTDWFDLFVVIGSMVVLITLTVVIITAIRGSGMISGGESSHNGAGKVGTA